MVHYLNFLFLGTLGWGVSLYLIKILLPVLSPAEIVFYRMLIGAVTLCLLSKILYLKINNWRGLIIDGFILGLFNMSLPFYLTTYSEKSISTALSAVINGLTPLFTFMVAKILFQKNEFNRVNLISILLGFLGIILINVDYHLFQHGNFLGLCTLILASICYAISANYVQIRAKTENPLILSAVATLLSSMMLLLWRLIIDGAFRWHLPKEWPQWLALLWLGMFGSGICLFLYCLLINKKGSVIASMITYLMTITGVLVGIYFLQETFSTMSLIGCIFIVCSLLMINHGKLIFTLLDRFYVKKAKETNN